MTLKLYQYDRCGTCRKARQWLDGQGIAYESIDITQTPPSQAELEQMLAFQGGQLRKLFNTSGQRYRELKLSDRLPTLSADEALALLASDGKLIKRPFLLTGTTGLVGFRAPEWQQALG
jgi:arsenate reductase